MDNDIPALLRETLDGRVESFRPLVEKYQDMLFDLAFRLAGNREDAEDIVQTAFTRMYSRLRQYDPKYRFETWAYTITLNVARNHLRHKALIRFFSLDFLRGEAEDEPSSPEPADSGQDMDSHIRGTEIRTELRARVGQLPWKLKESFVLHYYHYHPAEAIAAMLGTNANTVKLRLFRARKILYPQLAGRFPEEMGIKGEQRPPSQKRGGP